MKFEQLIKLNHQLLSSIYQHPFNQQLCKGNLSNAVFRFYLEQDRIYLNKYAEALKLVSKRCEHSYKEYAAHLQRFSEDTVAAEKEVQEKYLTQLPVFAFFSPVNIVTPIISSYTAHLLENAKNASLPVAVASLLPCFWVYKELGVQMMQFDHSQNPYSEWVKSYASEQFQLSTEVLIRIADELNQQVICPVEKKEIELAFQKSALYELEFFDTAFNSGMTKENKETIYGVLSAKC